MLKEKFMSVVSGILDLVGPFTQFLLGWVENLMDNIISIKVWFLGICVYMCMNGKITGGEFITAFLAVVGLREGYKIARSYFAPKLGPVDEDTSRRLKKI